jgi:hypothetical protein
MYIENDEEQNGTIFNANSGMGSANSCTCSQTNYKSIANDISTRKIAKGVKVGGTIDDISIGKTTKGAEP